MSVNYLLIHQDGSREHILRQERDALLAQGKIKQTGPRKYRSTTRPAVFRLTATENTLQTLALQKNVEAIDSRAFLPGSFVVIAPDKRKHHEMLETPAHLAVRLPSIIAQLNREANA